MSKQTSLLLRAILAVFAVYAVLGGATYTGMLTPRYQWLSLILLSLLVIGWFAVRTRGRWIWPRTALDPVIPLWGVAIALALIVNPDALRRTGISLWYLSAYVGVWLMLQDAIANRALQRNAILEALLIGGGIVIIFGMVQLWSWFNSHTGSLLDLPRITSTLDNPNFLASMLLIVMPVAGGVALAFKHRLLRGLMIVFLACAGLLLIASDSRGGWVAGGVATLSFGLLLLAHHNLLSGSALRHWWSQQRWRVRGVTSVGIAIGLLALVTGGYVILNSLNAQGRTSDLRTYIYSAAFTLFRERPLTGWGLFTFGRGLMRLSSVPPMAAQAHAHDLILNVAAELGLIGLAALTVSFIWILIEMRHYWRTTDGPQRIVTIGAIAGVIGLLTHNLLDLTGTAAVITVAGLLLLSLAVPVARRAVSPITRLVPFGVAVGWIVLIAAGFWSNQIYSTYFDAMNAALATGDYAKSIASLQGAINVDPAPIYLLQQGILLGTQANTGDLDSAKRALADFEQFCAVEPTYAPGWANLAAMRWQLGDLNGAVMAMQRAAALATDDWPIFYNLGRYAEAGGQPEIARSAYQHVLALNPDLALLPDWSTSALRQSLTPSMGPYSTLAQMLLAIESGQFDTAQHLAISGAIGSSPAAQAMLMVIRSGAQNLNAADANPWTHWARATLAKRHGESAMYQTELDAVKNYVETAPPETVPGDFATLASAQFYTVGLGQYYVPQIYAPSVDPLLAWWVAKQEAHS
jgi:tetratricopeptide (TPR) repeat protein